MTNYASPADSARRPPASSPQARFEFLPASEGAPATVRAVGDITLD